MLPCIQHPKGLRCSAIHLSLWACQLSHDGIWGTTACGKLSSWAPAHLPSAPKKYHAMEKLLVNCLYTRQGRVSSGSTWFSAWTIARKCNHGVLTRYLWSQHEHQISSRPPGRGSGAMPLEKKKKKEDMLYVAAAEQRETVNGEERAVGISTGWGGLTFETHNHPHKSHDAHRQCNPGGGVSEVLCGGGICDWEVIVLEGQVVRKNSTNVASPSW